MPFPAFNIMLALPAFAMVLFRIGGMTISAPLISSNALPRSFKIAFTFVVSLMLLPAVGRHLPTDINMTTVIANVVGEMFVGLIIGTSVGLIFVGVRLAGTVIGQQAGIALSQVINPMQNEQGTIMGQIYDLVVLALFLAIGGHRYMIAVVLDSYVAVPPGMFAFDRSFLTLLVDLVQSAFVLGMRLAAPALIALMLASLVMGFLSKTIPQLNILTVGFSIRIMIGMFTAAISLSLAFELLTEHMFDVMDRTRFAFGMTP